MTSDDLDTSRGGQPADASIPDKENLPKYSYEGRTIPRYFFNFVLLYIQRQNAKRIVTSQLIRRPHLLHNFRNHSEISDPAFYFNIFNFESMGRVTTCKRHAILNLAHL